MDSMSSLHPLLDIDHVLVHVLSSLDLGDLKSASLVCKKWCEHGQKLLIRKGVLAVNELKAKEFLINESVLQSLNFNNFHSLQNVIYRSGGVQLRLYLWYHIDIPSNSEECESNRRTITWNTVSSFLEKLLDKGTKISALNLKFCTSDTRIVWNLLCSVSSHLQCLNIETCPSCISEDCSGFKRGEAEKTSFPKLRTLTGKLNTYRSVDKILFRQLIVSSRNLEDLQCKLCSYRHDIFEILKETPNVLSNLKGVCSLSLNKDEMQVLTRKDFKLRNLSFRLHGGFRVPEMHSFLSSQGSSLESLEIDLETLPRNPEAFACGIDLVKMKYLSLKKFYGSIHFVEYMPNLESLSLEDINLSVALHDEAANHDYKSGLKSLKIFGGRGSTGRFLFPAVYYDIIKFFPDLKELRMEYFTDSTLRILVEGLPNLEILDIPNGIYSDAILTRDICDECDQDSDETETTNSKQVYCLTDLKKLRKLIIHSPKITDVGVRLGLLNCRNLKYLSINSPMISDVSLELLCGAREIRHLEFVNCYQLTKGSIENAKSRWGTHNKLLFSHV